MAVLLSIWSLLIQCFPLFGGLLDSIGCLPVVNILLRMHLNYTGLSFFFLGKFYIKVSSLLFRWMICACFFSRLCITFLAFDVFFVVICVAVACVVGIAVCCCLPCIIAILYAVADQVIPLCSSIR